MLLPLLFFVHFLKPAVVHSIIPEQNYVLLLVDYSVYLFTFFTSFEFLLTEDNIQVSRWQSVPQKTGKAEIKGLCRGTGE